MSESPYRQGVPMVKCGRCKERHTTAAEVRDCYARPVADTSIPTPAPAPALAPEPEAAPATGPIYDGVYTVEKTTGKHRTFRLRTNAADDKFAPGKQVIGYLSGADNENSYTNFGFVEDGKVKVWKRFAMNVGLLDDARQLLADPEASIKMAHCFRCHRPLTVPASVHAGLGPECAKKAAL